MVEDIKADKKIIDLASVILKIEQSIEPKFLRRPLGNIVIFIFNFRKIKNKLAFSSRIIIIFYFSLLKI